ncbi:MAG TPA: hypothetical protein VFE31_10060 [Opitutaceae bacterium]|jgi:hypothetical protein|nr:hypothetical protein [Opitutaceae bacterium]
MSLARSEPSYVLTTRVERLLRDWQRQLPAPEFPHRDDAELRRELRLPGPRVWIADAGDERAGWECHADTVRVIVGQPQNPAFEAMRQREPRAFFLSYVESQARLDAVLPAAAALTEQNAVITLLRARAARPEAPPPRAAADPRPPERAEDWLFLESALDHLENREALLSDFQRLVRSRLEAMRALVFVREGADFRAAPPEAAVACPAASPLVGWLEDRAAMLDLDSWNGDTDTGLELEVRRRMAQWRVKLLIPFLIRGRLHGWLCVGPRADGLPHSEISRQRALGMARLFESLLDRHERGRDLLRLELEHREYQAYLPGARILTAQQALAEDLPTVVRAVIGEAFHTGKLVVHEPQRSSPLRIAATPVPGDKVAVSWMDCTGLMLQVESARHMSRLSALTEVGLLMQHQLGNALQIASTVQEMLAAGEAPPEPVIARFGQDLDRLGKLQRLLGALTSAADANPHPLDTRELAEDLRAAVGCPVAIDDPAPVLLTDRRTLTDALVALISSVAPTTVEILRRGEGEDVFALICVRGLKATPPGLTGSATAQHADLEVFVAREVIQRQGGAVEVAQGIHGPELHFSLGRVQALTVKSSLPGISRLGRT